MELGYFLSSEEHGLREVIGPAQDEFFEFLASDLAPALESIDIHRGAPATARAQS